MSRGELHRELVMEIFTALFTMNSKTARINPLRMRIILNYSSSQLAYMLVSKGCYSILKQRSFWKTQAALSWSKVFSKNPDEFPYHDAKHANFMRMTWDLNERFLPCWHIHACGEILGSYQEGIRSIRINNEF